MPSFIAGSGPLSLGDSNYNLSSIYYVAVENGCAIDQPNGVSLYDQWNETYRFSPEFNAPYNMGFFYDQGCAGTLVILVNFYADPYSDNPANWGVYYKVGTTGTETLIDTLAGRATYDECTEYRAYVSTKGGLGQSGNTVYVGIRRIGKSATPAYYDAAAGTECPNTNNNDYGGTYDYPGTCPDQYSDFLESSFSVKAALTVDVDKSGYIVTC